MIINAKDAMEEEGGKLTIATARVSEWVEVKLADTGCGIPGDKLDKIFKPLFTTKPESKGTGLGLSISLAIVERHQGRIDVASEVGKGTAFTIKLPISDENKS